MSTILETKVMEVVKLLIIPYNISSRKTKLKPLVMDMSLKAIILIILSHHWSCPVTSMNPSVKIKIHNNSQCNISMKGTMVMNTRILKTKTKPNFKKPPTIINSEPIRFIIILSLP